MACFDTSDFRSIGCAECCATWPNSLSSEIEHFRYFPFHYERAVNSYYPSPVSPMFGSWIILPTTLIRYGWWSPASNLIPVFTGLPDSDKSIRLVGSRVRAEKGYDVLAG